MLKRFCQHRLNSCAREFLGFNIPPTMYLWIFYLIYLPHLALPLAASCTVMPLEHELRNITADKIIIVKRDGFFITGRFCNLYG